MPLHQEAPDLGAIRDHVFSLESNRVSTILAAPIDDSHYYHWSQLIRRDPPGDLTHEEWWFALKFRRQAQMRELPLHRKNGQPFTFALTDEVLRLTDQVARRLGGPREDAAHTLTRHNRDMHVVRSLVEEAITSSQLEGASTTRRIAVDLLDSGRAPVDVSERMIVNNYMGMEFAKKHASELLTPTLVLELHRILTEGTLDDPDDAGRLETTDRERVSVRAGEKQVHVPPPAGELPARLDSLCTFANGSSSDTPYIPPVVRAIITHFMFGYDHYFADGNGRAARAAFYWSMLRQGFWMSEFLSISTILRKTPGQYGDAYQYSEDDDGDVTYFILHQLSVLIRALDQLDEYIDTKTREAKRFDRALRDAREVFNERQSRMIEWLLREDVQVLTVAIVARRYRVSGPTARTDLVHLESLGLLRRGEAKRPVMWSPVAGLRQRLESLADQEG